MVRLNPFEKSLPIWPGVASGRIDAWVAQDLFEGRQGILPLYARARFFLILLSLRGAGDSGICRLQGVPGLSMTSPRAIQYSPRRAAAAAPERPSLTAPSSGR
jgi:hypothetical protein